MIPALGAGGREFDSRITPFVLQLIFARIKTKTVKKKLDTYDIHNTSK
jgi:hypothetical protein